MGVRVEAAIVPKFVERARAQLFCVRNAPRLNGCWISTPPPPCISYTLVQATVGVGTVLIWYLILIRYQI